MELSYDIMSQLAKVVTKNDKKQQTGSIVYGTIKLDANGNKYVQFDSSGQLTPLSDDNQPTVESTTANVKENDRVSVLIKDHTATVIGNMSHPSASNEDIEKSISNFDIAIGEQIQANRAYFKELIADDVKLNKLSAAIISVVDLIATEADIENLIAGKITVTDLIADKIDADVVISDKAIIEKLQSSNIDVLSLIADKAIITDLIANNADLDSLEAKNAYLKYATIDFTNIGEAAVKKLFASSGIIKELSTGEAYITGELVGVTLKGDLIEAGTLKADRLVVKGENGLYYKLNIDALGETTASSDEKYQNGLDGSAIVANSITAEKLRVDDLVAFDAKIAGFNMVPGDDEKPAAIYSGEKGSVDADSITGIYIDEEGQMNIGNEASYFKFYKDQNGIYQLAISAKTVYFGTGKDFMLDDRGITIEGLSDDSNNVIKSNMSNNGFTVHANEKKMLKADDKGVEAIDLHAKTYLIVGENSRFENYGNNRTGCFWIGE